MKEISIEDYRVDEDSIYVAFFHHNDFKELTAPLDHLEQYVNDNGLLEWCDIVMQNNEAVDQKEGVWQFSEYVKERLDADIVKQFLISELQKMKSA